MSTRTQDITASLVAMLEARKQPTLVLTEIALDGDWGNSGRLDVVALTFGPRRTTIIEGFEVKVSRSDFAKDVDTLKAEKYRRSVDRMSYAVPVGLVRKPEVPPGIGLLTVSDGGRWQTVTRPDFAAREDTGQLVRILRRCYDDRRRTATRGDDPQIERALRIVRMFDRAQDLHTAEHRYGLWLGRAVRERIAGIAQAETRATRLVQNAEIEAERIIRRARNQAAGLAELGPTTDVLRAVLDVVDRALKPAWGMPPLSPAEAESAIAAIVAAREQASTRYQPPTE